MRRVFFFMRADGAQLKTLAQLYDAGVLRPVLDRTFPFERLTDAHTYMLSDTQTGKIVLMVDESGR